MEAEAASSRAGQPPHSQAKEDRTPEQSKSSKVTPPKQNQNVHRAKQLCGTQATQAAFCEMAGEESNEVVNYKQTGQQGLVARKYVFLIWRTFCLCVFAFSGQNYKTPSNLRKDWSYSSQDRKTGFPQGRPPLAKRLLGQRETEQQRGQRRAGQPSPGPLFL